jgi:hypothetical protein
MNCGTTRRRRRWSASASQLEMNKDESGRRVFDGALAHTAGAGKVSRLPPIAVPLATYTG